MSFLERAAFYYNAEPHQVAAWRGLEEYLDPFVLERFKRAYRGEQQDIDDVMDVVYFWQRDSKTGQGERMCFSSSMAMALDYLRPEVIEADDDWYLGIVNYFGDSTSSDAQVRAARSLGYDAIFRTNGTQRDIEDLVDAEVPVPVGVLHKGHIGHPTGGGHWICVVGHNNEEFICHDPFGEMDLVNGGYPKAGPTDGKFVRYDKAALMERWLIASDSDGWFMDLSENR